MRSVLLALAFVLASCLPARAAVTFDANATAPCGSATVAVTNINCSTLTVGTGANRALVCLIIWNGATSAITLTWDNGGTNQTMTAITNGSATNGAKVSLYGLVAPTSGAKQLRATWTTLRVVEVNCVSYAGADQTGGNTTFPNGANATGTSTTASVTITSAVGDAVVAVHGTNGACTCFTAVNQTQLFIDNTNVDSAANRAAGAASVALTATLSASAAWASAGTSIKAFPCTPSLTLLGVGRCN